MIVGGGIAYTLFFKLHRIPEAGLDTTKDAGRFGIISFITGALLSLIFYVDTFFPQLEVTVINFSLVCAVVVWQAGVLLVFTLYMNRHTDKTIQNVVELKQENN
jgi:heme/copper-type cytochrome/quinol oxidase subunit 4